MKNSSITQQAAFKEKLEDELELLTAEAINSREDGVTEKWYRELTN